MAAKPAIIHALSLTLFFALLFFPKPTFAAQASESSPSPSPQLPPQANSPSQASPAPSPNSPTPAPSPADDDSASPKHKKSSPSPAPDAPADAGQENQTHLGDLPDEDDSGGGMSGGKKFGIAIGVIFGGCAVGLAVVYRKRQRNIRRANYRYTDRRDFL